MDPGLQMLDYNAVPAYVRLQAGTIVGCQLQVKSACGFVAPAPSRIEHKTRLMHASLPGLPGTNLQLGRMHLHLILSQRPAVTLPACAAEAGQVSGLYCGLACLAMNTY